MRNKLIAVCLNPCIDKMVTIPSFTYGGMNRIREIHADASGKGVNVGIVAERLGLPSLVTGFLFRSNGHLVEERLAKEHVESDFLWMDGEIRTNLKVFDLEKSIVTEINESGTPAGEDMLFRMAEKINSLTDGNSFLVLTGSLPPETPRNYYRLLLEKAAGSFTVLDAEGDVFLEGLAAHPCMVKPNSYELSLAVDRQIQTLEDVIHGAEILIRKGIGIVCVSMGSEGAYITNGKERYYAPPVKIPILSTVGAGDCVVAGILAAMSKEKPLIECFRSGVAAASAALSVPGTQLCIPEQYASLWDQVVIETL